MIVETKSPPPAALHWLLGKLAGVVFAFKLADVEPPLAAGVVHVADLAKNGPFGPAVVVRPTDGPHAA